MTKLIIDERDIRCTILEVVRKADARLNLNAEAFAKEIADAVIVCGDPIVASEKDHSEPCPICDFGTPTACTDEAIRFSCGHWLKIRPADPPPRAHTECVRMGGTGPCACLDGCGACDSCGQWLGENDNEPVEKS